MSDKVVGKILKPNTLVAVITNNYTTGSVAKIKSTIPKIPSAPRIGNT